MQYLITGCTFEVYLSLAENGPRTVISQNIKFDIALIPYYKTKAKKNISLCFPNPDQV